MMDNTHRILAVLMKDQGLNQIELSRTTGLKQSTISRILNPGAVNGIKLPSDAQVRPVAAFFGVSTDQLRGYEALKATLPSLPNFPHACQSEVLLQQLRSIKDTQIFDSVSTLVKVFSEGNLSQADARMIEEFAVRLAMPATARLIRSKEISQEEHTDTPAP
jgi:transcriptional regulator with XRE-family HTH domain